MKAMLIQRDMTMKEIEEYTRIVQTKGQVTLPQQIRQLLGVQAGDQVLFRVVEGVVEVQPVSMTLEKTFGAVTPKNSPEDFLALRDVAVEEHAQKVVEEMKD
jgi:AbrB family looped-hinge helix DNA binding protein